MSSSDELVAPRSLARGALSITLAAAVSRITGFVRVVVVAAAMGTTFVANTYQTANTAPNLLFELAAAGVLTSIFVPTFVSYLTTRHAADDWDGPNALASFALVGLTGLALLLALAAPAVMRLLTMGVSDANVRAAEVRVGTQFLWMFAPQVIFYGAGMIMTAALHAHRRFGAAAVAPIANNVVVITVYLTYARLRGDAAPDIGEISRAEILLLGLGTTAGVVAMTLWLVPACRSVGWRFRFTWRPRHEAVSRGVRLGAWALGYAGGYQAGLVVVLLLANRIAGGVAAYQWAFTFFYVPHALFAIPIFSVLFTAMSEHAVRDEIGDVAKRLREGLGMMIFVLLPTALGMVILGEPLASVTISYGVMSADGALLVGRVLAAFAVGLPLYSSFLILTRTFYALGDTRLPTLANLSGVIVASVVGATAFFVAPRGWEVPGLALGHSVGALVSCIWLARALLAKGIARRDGSLRASVWRSVGAAVLAALPMGAARASLGDNAWAALGLGAAAGAVLYLAAHWIMRSPELSRLRALVSVPR